MVLSHGHFDHAGGLAGLAGTWGDSVAADGGAPEIWTRQRLEMPGPKPDQLQTLSKRALEGDGFAVIKRREPSLLADGSVVTAARY